MKYKRQFSITAFVALLVIKAAFLFGQAASKIAPEVSAAITQHNEADVLVIFHEQADISRANDIKGKTAKARYVFDALQQTAQRTQARAWQLLHTYNTGGNSLFIANALAIPKAPLSLIQQLAALSEVKYIADDPWIRFEGSDEPTQTAPEWRNAIEWGVARVHAPEVWAMGFNGTGITIGGADTGYEWTHPALQSHYRGWNAVDNQAGHNYHWHDAIHDYSPLNYDTLGNPGINPCGLNSAQPCDDHFHGTHTMGTMTGDDGLGNQIGVAPGAKWIGCRNMERGYGRPSTYLECFQWFLAPTDLNSQNPDINQAPHVINNSWYCDYIEGCTDLSVNELLHTAVINLKASGVFVVVSNGNFGSNCATTYGAPAYFEESFSVGALRSNDTIAGFSSRGPVIIDQSDRIKPNISAPGVNVRSSILNGQYGNASGTSMAGPHVAGVVALILSARPDLAGEVNLLEDILETTAYPLYDTIDCGNVAATAIPNNTYGYGGIDALGAVNKALALTNSGTATVPQVSVEVAPNPVHSTATFTFGPLSGPVRLIIWDAAGRQVYSRHWEAQGVDSCTIPFHPLATGVYHWHLTTPQGVVSGKISKI